MPWSKEKRKKYYNTTLKGFSNRIVNNCISKDKKYKRIGNELPEDYIDVEWTMNEIQKGCVYKDKCGTTDWRKIGLNRKDNSLPHTKSNCEPCCWECNNKLGKESKKKLVDQIDILTGKIIKSYQSLKEAAESIGTTSGNISACCHGRLKQTSGYVWRFKRTKKEED